MKKHIFIITIIIVSLFSQEAFSLDANLSQYEIINLHSEDTSVKVLVGVANVRFKATKGKNITLAIPNNDFKIIGQYLPNDRKISNQTERFNKYSKEQQQRILECEEILSRTFIIEFNPKINILKFCNKLLNGNYDIEIAEPHYVNSFYGIPNDPEVLNQNQEVLTHIKAFEAWDICEGDSTLLIGVGDSGFNIDHKDLENQITFNEAEIPYNGIDDDGNGYIDDYKGYNMAYKEEFELNGGNSEYEHCDNLYNGTNPHGMNVMGIIGARTNNQFGIAGVGNKCKLVPIRLQRRYDEYVYGYQSLSYAAVRGCKVLNCSWGNAKHFSVVDKSIVDYAIACDVAIIASAGNISGSHAFNYPAAYYGVLGVGGCEPNDEADLTRYTLGPATRILAQAQGNRTLGLGHEQIVSVGNGTSHSAPVVSGVLGIVRSYRPELSPQEAIELTRVTADSITGSGGFVPNRVNMYKALTTEPDLTPAIILKEQYFESLQGERINKMDLSKYSANDTFNLILKIKNILGDAKNVNISLTKIFEANEGTFNILDSVFHTSELNKNEEFEIKIRMNINFANSIRGVYYKLSMLGENKEGTSFKDNFNFYVQAITKLNTIENQNMIVTIRDDGGFGFDEPTTNIRNGFGLTHKKYGDFLWTGSLVTISEYSKVSTNFTNLETTYSPLTTSLLEINNIKIKTEYTYPTDTSSVLKSKITAINQNTTPLLDFSIGHFYDWDINNYDFDETGFFEEAIPPSLDINTAAAQFATDLHQSVFIGSLVFINKAKYPDISVIPQASGHASSSNFPIKQDLIIGLTSGISYQTDDITDIAYMIGMHYPIPIEGNDTVECIICTGLGRTKFELANALIECANTEVGIASPKVDWYNLKIIDGKLEIISYLDSITFDIFDILGEKLLSQKLNLGDNTIDITNFPHSVYWIRLNNGHKVVVEKVIW